MFRSVSREEFKDTSAGSAASPAFRELYDRFIAFDTLLDTEAMVHAGDLRVQGNFRLPGKRNLRESLTQLSSDFPTRARRIMPPEAS